MEEIELISQCKLGNRNAYKVLYETYSSYLKGICLRYVASQDSANDILHDSFVKILGAVNRFSYKGDGSLKAWMSRVVMNTALTYLQKDKSLDYVDHIDAYEKPDDEPDENYYDLISNELVIRFIQELPVAYRTVFNMYMFEDITHSEIGRLLGIKEVSSRVRLTRARTMLAQKIRDYVSRENI